MSNSVVHNDLNLTRHNVDMDIDATRRMIEAGNRQDRMDTVLKNQIVIMELLLEVLARPTRVCRLEGAP